MSHSCQTQAWHLEQRSQSWRTWKETHHYRPLPPRRTANQPQEAELKRKQKESRRAGWPHWTRLSPFMKHPLCSARLSLQDRHGTTPRNPRTQLAEARGFQVWGQPQLQSKTLSWSENRKVLFICRFPLPIYNLTYRSAGELSNSTASQTLQPPCDPHWQVLHW